jgi:gliding motility-associated-like protein
VKNNGTVWSFGRNFGGVFGDGTIIDNVITPVQMEGVADAVRVASSFGTNFVLLSDGTVLGVGSNSSGHLGDPSYTDNLRLLAGPVPGLSGIVDIKTNTRATAALNDQGEVYCWGLGEHTGDGDLLNDTLPKRLVGLNNIVAISGCTDGYHFLALDADRNCYAWGNLNTAEWLFTPQLIATDVIDIMAGEIFSYIVKSDGSLWAQGSSFANDASIWLNVPNDYIYQQSSSSSFIQLDPSAVAGSCPLVVTVAIPSGTCGSGSISVTHVGGQAPYTYDIGNGPQNSNFFTGLALGNYSVTVTDANGCVTTIPCLVASNEPQPIAAAVAQDLMIEPGGSTLLFGSGGSTYAWAPSTTLSCSDCANPTATPTETTTYCVTVSDSACSDTACVRIEVTLPASACTAASIFIPTAFSPNASGKNDMQCIYGGDCIASMVFRIYDRWGNKVFESTDPKQCWDGLYKGDALDPGVFVYSFNATLSNGEVVQKKGNITLIR